jgi:hypothetical protein
MRIKYIGEIKIVIIIVLFFASYTEAKSQDYKKICKIYKNVHIADSLYEIKDYKNAINFYKKSKDAY